MLRQELHQKRIRRGFCGVYMGPSQEQLTQYFELYYEKYKNLVYSRCLRLMLDNQGLVPREDAHDVFQHIFSRYYEQVCRIWNAEHRLLCPKETEKLLNKITTNALIDYWEKNIKPRRTPSDRDSTGSPNTGTANPEDHLLRTEFLLRVERCLGKLKSHESSALLLKADRYSDRDIAALLGLDATKVTHSTIPMARKKLRKCLDNVPFKMPRTWLAIISFGQIFATGSPPGWGHPSWARVTPPPVITAVATSRANPVAGPLANGSRPDQPNGGHYLPFFPGVLNEFRKG